MSQLRYDPTTNDWVIIAPSRAFRPHERVATAEKADAEKSTLAKCPFCPGNEALTPPQILSAALPGGSGSAGWRVRVVPNRFPALRIEEQPERREDSSGFFFMAGCGAHEIVIESPDHRTALCQQPVEQIELVLSTLQGRYRDLMRDRRFQTVIIFKNHGQGAGTSLVHPHWQVIATPVVPRMLRIKHIEAAEFFDRTGECLYCAAVQRELEDGRRIVGMNDHFVAFLPYASHCPFETWIVPRRHEPSFTLVEPARLRPLSELMKSVLLQLYTALDNPDFNLTVDDVPRGDADKEWFLWHMRILPRLATPAGFELGSGMSINAVVPEDAAAFLRESTNVPKATP